MTELAGPLEVSETDVLLLQQSVCVLPQSYLLSVDEHGEQAHRGDEKVQSFVLRYRLSLMSKRSDIEISQEP